MGFGYQIVRLYTELKDAGFFDEVSKVMELGSQEVVCSGHEKELRTLFQKFGARSMPDEQLSSLARGGSARELYEALGFKYYSVDSDGLRGAIPLDLNVDSVPDGIGKTFDLVTNYGTTEHVANQTNCFKFIHDVAREGAFIIHEVTFQGWVGHGFFNYQPNFFADLAVQNDYELLGTWVNSYPNNLHKFTPWESWQSASLKSSNDMDFLLLVIMRKGAHREFVFPFQGAYRAAAVSEVSTRYGTSTSAERRSDGRQAARIREAVSRVTGEAIREPHTDTRLFRRLARVVSGTASGNPLWSARVLMQGFKDRVRLRANRLAWLWRYRRFVWRRAKEKIGIAEGRSRVDDGRDWLSPAFGVVNPLWSARMIMQGFTDRLRNRSHPTHHDNSDALETGSRSQEPPRGGDTQKK